MSKIGPSAGNSLEYYDMLFMPRILNYTRTYLLKIDFKSNNKSHFKVNNILNSLCKEESCWERFCQTVAAAAAVHKIL